MQLSIVGMSHVTHVWKHDIRAQYLPFVQEAYPPGRRRSPEEVCMIDTLVEEHCDQRIVEVCILGRRQEVPVVISSTLTNHQEDCLLEVLRRYSPWVNPTQVVQKKSGITVVQMIRENMFYMPHYGGVCINYRKLNAVTRKDHFLLPFIDQVLERVSEHPFYCFLDGYSGYMLSIFSDIVERIMEVFMDDITIYGSTFDECLVNLEAILKRCIEKDLVLNWKKCHFMVHQGIVLGHIISKEDIEVDRAKVELIVKLPFPTNVKGVRQFLGHVGFYWRFIKDFSKLAKASL
ncbi:Retrovirus-related Pol polyprotein from transposon 17.6 [Vitis vinifera]|uniref:Retrovirus-related Pol polyprotein from transposon 17.6 n=1 Tax=Vitis vinifera TaxID=29760 RepID=A0A438F1E2_VITVI|nr:Retrovirus-related Pol polyprotein from transposon 17.6 [Vitis vinifera]